MNGQFSISVSEWLPSDSNNEIERATTAEVEIRVGEECATQVEDFQSRTVRSTIRVAAEPLAKWLLANWWRLRWETEPVLTGGSLNWAMSHSTAAVGHGYIWPDLVFKGSDGQRILTVCKRHLSPLDQDLSPIRFLNSFECHVHASDFDDSVRAFVDSVVARMDSMGIRRSELHDLRNDLVAEWSNQKLTSYRKLEALLGLDPDEDDGVISFLQKASKWFGESAVQEISAAAGRQKIEALFDQTKKIANTVKSFADVPCFEDVASDLGNSKSIVQIAPWQRGQDLAYALRSKWGFGFDPISNKDLADRLNINPAKLEESKLDSPLSFGVKSEVGTRKLGFIMNRANDHGRRFDIARMIGDHISRESNDRVVPVTNAVTERQKLQRAFAAEFLCPSEMIRNRYSNGVDQQSLPRVVDEIASTYNVADRVVLHHLENRQVLAPHVADASLLFA